MKMPVLIAEMESARLIVIRHGETEWNVKGLWQGQLNSLLTARGEKQAAAVAECLRSFDIDEVYSSDLGRCIQTAQPIADVLGVSIRKDERLRERGFGVLEGLTKEESQEKYPGLWDQLAKKDLDFAPDGGESLNQKQIRFSAVFQEIGEQSLGKTVLVFTHGGGVDAMLRKTLGLELYAERPYTLWNCALNTFQWNGRRWIVDSFGETHHLKGIESAFRPR